MTGCALGCNVRQSIDMLATTQLDEEQRLWLRLLTDTSGLLLMVVNDVLDYTKIDAGACTCSVHVCAPVCA